MSIYRISRKAPEAQVLSENYKPLTVRVGTACKILGVGNTTMWSLIKSGRVKTISVGRRRLVVFSTLESLVADGQRGES